VAPIVYDPRSPSEVTSRTPIATGKTPKPHGTRHSPLSPLVLPLTPNFERDSVEGYSPVKVRGSSIFAVEESSEHSMSFDAAEDDHNTSTVDVTILDSSLVLRESAASEAATASSSSTAIVITPLTEGPEMNTSEGDQNCVFSLDTHTTLAFTQYQDERSLSSEDGSASNDHLLSPAASEGSLSGFPSSTDLALRQESLEEEQFPTNPENPTPCGKNQNRPPQMTPLATALEDFNFGSTPSPIDQQASIRLGAIPPSPSSPTFASSNASSGTGGSSIKKRNSLGTSRGSTEKKNRRNSMIDTHGLKSPSVKLRLFESRGRSVSVDKQQHRGQQPQQQPHIFEDPAEEASATQVPVIDQQEMSYLTVQSLSAISGLDKENLGSPKKKVGGLPSTAAPGKKTSVLPLRSPAKSFHHNKMGVMSPLDSQKRRSLSENAFY